MPPSLRNGVERDRKRISLKATVLLIAMGLVCMPLNAPSLASERGQGGRHTAPPACADINSVVTHLTDLAATIHVAEDDPKELEKIGKDFARTYALRTLTLLYKQPDLLRLDGKSSALGDATLILNGTQRFYTVPRFHLKKVENLKDSPSKRQSLLEYGGLVAPETLRFMQARFVKQEALDGQETQVYDLTYRGVANGSSYRVWIDTKTHVTIKRAWYNTEKKLKATFYYLEPREVSDGFWFPTRIEVKNAEGVRAAVTTLEDVQVNQGLNDDLFSIAP